MDKYLMYLRKSRMDNDYDEISVEETLKRHQQILNDLATKNNYFIEKIYKEVVSGESISERPEVQNLLADVSTGEYAGVLVVDIDRLSRGSGIDTGYITQVFMYGDCKIITPAKIYDLTNEYDEQFTDMKFLFSRYEYKTINKRLERGRKISASEGRFMGSAAPYGYEIVKIKGDKGNTLKIYEHEANVIKMIFEWYVNEGLGYRGIAIRLDDLGIKTRTGVMWSVAVVRTMIKNPIYCGKIRVSHKKVVKKIVNGEVKKVRQYDYNSPKYPGLHEPIISEELWNKAQQVSVLNNKMPVKSDRELKNVFAGVLYCKRCGHKMTRAMSGGRGPRFRCSNLHCKMPSASFAKIEENVLKALELWLDEYKLNIKSQNHSVDISPLKKSLGNIENELEKLNSQQQKTCELLEQGIYSIEMFQKRNSTLDTQIKDLATQKNNIIIKINEYEKKKETKNIVPKTIQGLLENYSTLSVEEKNRMIKMVLSRIDYDKDSKTRELKIEITPII